MATNDWLDVLADKYEEGVFKGNTTVCPAKIHSKMLIRNQFDFKATAKEF